MKKVLAAIAATLGFFGLATFIIFSAETAGSTQYNNQLADISAVAATSAPAADQPGPSEIPQAAPPDVVPSNDTASTTATTALPASTTTSAAPLVTPAAPAPATPQAATPPPQPTPPQPIPTPPIPTPPEAPAIDTSTIATATITVSPTAPIPPALPPPPENPAASPGGLALPYNESSFAGDNNWQATWGIVNTTWSGSLDLSAGVGSTGGAVTLKNSTAWTGYTMRATVDWVEGAAFALMANYTDPGNYLACEYARDTSGAIAMRLVQYQSGNKILLTPLTSVSNDATSSLSVGIGVNGIYGTCSWNGQSVSNDVIGVGMSPMSFPGSGGIGFSVRDPSPNASEIIIKSVSAS